MKYHLLLYLILSSLISTSQINYDLEFSYDISGNQVLREFAVTAGRPAPEPTYLKTTKAYPSPMLDDLTLEWKIEEAGVALVKIATYNLMGQLIHSVVPEKDVNKMPLNFIGHISGVYIIKFYYDDDSENVIKVLKK
jgi:hypothetical protein